MPQTQPSPNRRLPSLDHEPPVQAEFDSGQPRDFLPRLVAHALQVTGATAGQCWQLDSFGRLARTYTSAPAIFRWLEDPSVVSRHQDLLSQALYDRSLIQVPWQTSQSVDSDSPTLCFLACGNESSTGVFEFVTQTPATEEQYEELKALLATVPKLPLEKQVDAMPSLDHGPVEQSCADLPRDLLVDQVDVEMFCLLLHNQHELAYVANTAVNEMRRILRSDRVSLAIERGGKTVIAAVSGQECVDQRSQAMRGLTTLAEQVIRSGQSIDSSDALSDAAERTEGSIDLRGASGAAAFYAWPLFQPSPVDLQSDAHVSDQIAFASLIIEQFSSRPLPQQAEIERLTAHVAQATFHALNDQRTFLRPLRRRLGRVAEQLKLTRNRLKVAAVVLSLMTAAVTLISVPYRVTATGRLMPSEQFRAFARVTGQVQDVWVTTGQSVTAGQPLLRLHNEDLETRQTIISNSLLEKRKLLAAYRVQLDATPESTPQSARIATSAKIAQHSLEIQGLEQQRVSIDEQRQHAIVQSAIDGTVATFQPQDLLSGRPVNRGQLLLEVMNERGPWQLELQVPESKLAYLQATASVDEAQALSFVQATAPGKTFHGTVTSLASRTNENESGEVSVFVTGAVEATPSFRPTIGVEVTAKIACGRRSIVGTLFGDAYDWVRARLW